MDGPYTKAILVATAVAGVTWPWATPALNWALAPIARPLAQELARRAGTAAAQALPESDWADAAEYLPSAVGTATGALADLSNDHPQTSTIILLSLAAAIGYMLGSGLIGPYAWRAQANYMRELLQSERTARTAIRGGPGAIRLLAADMGITEEEARAWCDAWMDATKPLNPAPRTAPPATARRSTQGWRE